MHTLFEPSNIQPFFLKTQQYWEKHEMQNNYDNNQIYYLNIVAVQGATPRIPREDTSVDSCRTNHTRTALRSRSVVVDLESLEESSSSHKDENVALNQEEFTYCLCALIIQFIHNDSLVLLNKWGQKNFKDPAMNRPILYNLLREKRLSMDFIHKLSSEDKIFIAKIYLVITTQIRLAKMSLDETSSTRHLTTAKIFLKKYASVALGGLLFGISFINSHYLLVFTKYLLKIDLDKENDASSIALGALGLVGAPIIAIMACINDYYFNEAQAWERLYAEFGIAPD